MEKWENGKQEVIFNLPLYLYVEKDTLERYMYIIWIDLNIKLRRTALRLGSAQISIHNT